MSVKSGHVAHFIPQIIVSFEFQPQLQKGEKSEGNYYNGIGEADNH
jgi:hypothetical protein